MPKIPQDFHRNIFINCPFNGLYTPLFNAMIFPIHDVGFRPRCTLEVSDAGQFRLDQIMEVIAEYKYSIDDLSRTEAEKITGIPRFNMPLELGLDLGCRRFGRPYHKEKVCLILDTEQYRYRRFISDISGQDIHAHSGSEQRLTEIVRNWSRLELNPRTTIIPGGSKIFQRYLDFQKALPQICSRLGWNPTPSLFVDFPYMVALWIEGNPL